MSTSYKREQKIEREFINNNFCLNIEFLLIAAAAESETPKTPTCGGTSKAETKARGREREFN